MMNIVAHNLIAMNTQRQLGIQSNRGIKTSEKLSSGYRINRAADDAAGLSISEKMRRQIRGLRQASANIQDGVSFVQVADGALNEVHDILQRMNELSIKAANGTNTQEDRDYIQQEISQLSLECDRIFKETEFNSEKIWCEPYIPFVTGIARELKIYNETVDANGNVTFGGIIWGTDRYSWNEIDPDMYEAGTGKFNPGTYTIEVPAVALDIPADEYKEKGKKINLKLTVSEEGKLTSITRECSWSADANGITMDGVLYKWTDLESLNHNKSFDPNNIEAGYWGFNTYNGTHIWFEVPESAHDLSDVIDGINGSILDNLQWQTEVSTVQTGYAVGLVYGTDATVFDAPTIRVTNANKDVVTNKYYLYANQNGVWTENANGLELGTEKWQDLGWENSAGEFLPPHDSTNHFYYEYPNPALQPDNHAAVTGGIWHYTSENEGYNSTVLQGLDIQFMLLEEASKEGVINGINGVEIPAVIGTPSSAEWSSNNAYPKLHSESVTAELNFDFHKNIGRNFNLKEATLGTGHISKDNNGKMFLNIANGAKTRQLICKNMDTDSLEKQVQEFFMRSGGSFTLDFQDEDGNIVQLSFKVDALSEGEKKDITDNTVPKEYYSNMLLADIFSGDIKFKANDYAMQSLGYDRSSMSALGWANHENNIASYVDFNTTIDYTRELRIQAGTEVDQVIKIQYDVLNAAIIGVANVSVQDEYSAKASINMIKNAIEIVSEQRSLFGAYQNRLDHAMKINDNTAENTTASESVIRDADIAKESMQHMINSILSQAGQSMLAQANQSNMGILKLLE